MFSRSVSIICLTALAACDSSTEVIPLSDTGFAAEDSIIGLGNSFTLSDTPRIVSDGDQLSATSQEVVFNILDGDDSSVEAIIDGEAYLLEWIGGGQYQFVDGENVVAALRQGTARDEAEIIEVFSFIDGNLNTSQFVIGFDTDPAEVAARSGTATMTGELYLTARNGFDDAFGTGTVQLDVDFADATIGGAFNVTNIASINSDFVLPDATLEMEETDISENGFAGTISVTSGDLGGTLSDATYEGRFFGADAPTAGGTFIGVVDVPELDQPTFVNGAFLATE